MQFYFLLILLSLGACDTNTKNSAQGYAESEDLYLTSPYSGTLRSLAIARGAHVKKGDLIFQLDSNPEALQLSEIEKVLAEERALLQDLKQSKREPEINAAIEKVNQVSSQLSLAKLRMKRFRELYEKKAGTLDQSDAAKYRFEEIQALKKQREYELEFAKLSARQDKIFAQAAKVNAVTVKKDFFAWQVAQKSRYAPDAGTIADTFFVEGEWVPAGKPISAIQMPKYIWINFFVPVKLLPKIHAGQTVKLTCSGCSSSEGVIAYIAPEAEYAPPLVYSRDNNSKLVFRVKAKPMKPGLYKPGQPVTVTGF
ncbi:MAG: HlyD family efflux transporter periplasmic adaptor subunit [Legionella sp.]|nr:HlyD family efflux transporter periplasmic adaptor subunit [Legionella sp.]